jgi:hypothetical protein
MEVAREKNMRKSNSRLRLIAESPIPSPQLTDTCGNPSETYYWRHVGDVRREWQHEFWCPHVDSFELTLAEITRIESQVRRELYP